MKVVAGKYRGKNLKSPVDDRIRPTTTRIKETLFNVLQGYVQDSEVLDLFAGSGALGIECLSRGAKEVTFVDKSRDSINLVYENLRGIDGDFKVVNGDYAYALRNAYTRGKKYDLIFLDPPYASDCAEMAISLIIDLDLLAEDGIIIFEHGAEKTYKLDDKTFKQRTKKMGTVIAEFISRKKIALMTGSFDPFTRGHEAVLDECLENFDEVYVACLVNPDKTYFFNAAQRLKIVETVCEYKKGAHAIYSTDYAVDVAKRVGANVIVRGVRNDDDMRYEEDMAAYNRAHGVETEFVRLDCFREISSTRVRDEIGEGNFKNLPACVIPLLTSKEFEQLK